MLCCESNLCPWAPVTLVMHGFIIGLGSSIDVAKWYGRTTTGHRLVHGKVRAYHHFRQAARK